MLNDLKYITMQVTIKNKSSLLLINPAIIINGKSVGNLKNKEKEKNLQFSDDNEKSVYLRLFMIPLSNKIEISSERDQSILVSDDIRMRSAGIILFFVFLIGQIPVLKEGQNVSLWYIWTWVLVGYIGLLLLMRKKLEIEKYE
jgi:hypothetical protein